MTDEEKQGIRARITVLELEHGDLDDIIDRIALDPVLDQLQLRRLKKRIDREGTLKEVRGHRRYEKPSEKRRRKLKVAKFTAMLRARYADM